MKLSIITPSLNQGIFIERCIQSVLAQEGGPPEYVVFDGGSTDDTVATLKKFDGHIRWTSKPDKGQAHAINKGIMATSGDIIGWLNSDDVYWPGALRAVEQYFLANPDIEVVYGRADHIDAHDRIIEPYPTEPWNFVRLQETCFLCQPATFFRRRIVSRHGLLDQDLKYCMDYEYWLRLGTQAVRFGYFEGRLAGSRMYPENKTLGSRVEVHAEINAMFKRRFGRVPDIWLYNYAHAVVDRHVNPKTHPARYSIEIGTRSFLAALRWNHSLTRPMLKALLRGSN